MSTTKRSLILGIAVILLALPLEAAIQWEKKDHTEWSDKDAQKVLNDSPWGKTQVFSSPVSLFRGPTTGRQGIGQPPSSNSANATHINFRIRFLSARPIRQAIGRMLQLTQKESLSEAMAAQMKTFVSGEFLELIVLTVTCDSKESGANVQEAMSLLHSRGTGHLKNNTFLEVKGGKRVFIQEYQQPRQDGLGGRFIFPRLVDGKPFITAESEEIRFYTELSDDYRLDRRYKTRDMIYEGKLEY